MLRSEHHVGRSLPEQELILSLTDDHPHTRGVWARIRL